MVSSPEGIFFFSEEPELCHLGREPLVTWIPYSEANKYVRYVPPVPGLVRWRKAGGPGTQGHPWYKQIMDSMGLWKQKKFPVLWSQYFILEKKKIRYSLTAFIHALSRHLKSSEPQKTHPASKFLKSSQLCWHRPKIQATLEVKAGFQIPDLLG